jgi:uncharacterized protein YbjT (DUF2867 family)
MSQIEGVVVSKLAGRTVLTLAMVASLALVAPVIAGAKTLHPPTPLQQYRTALHAYQQAKESIDLTLHQSIASAKATEVAALSAAKTPAQTFLARVDFNEARATDVANWQTALSNLGPPPQPPANNAGPTTGTTAPPSF